MEAVKERPAPVVPPVLGEQRPGRGSLGWDRPAPGGSRCPSFEHWLRTLCLLSLREKGSLTFPWNCATLQWTLLRARAASGEQGREGEGSEGGEGRKEEEDTKEDVEMRGEGGGEPREAPSPVLKTQSSQDDGRRDTAKECSFILAEILPQCFGPRSRVAETGSLLEATFPFPPRFFLRTCFRRGGFGAHKFLLCPPSGPPHCVCRALASPSTVGSRHPVLRVARSWRTPQAEPSGPATAPAPPPRLDQPGFGSEKALSPGREGSAHGTSCNCTDCPVSAQAENN